MSCAIEIEEFQNLYLSPKANSNLVGKHLVNVSAHGKQWKTDYSELLKIKCSENQVTLDLDIGEPNLHKTLSKRSKIYEDEFKRFEYSQGEYFYVFRKIPFQILVQIVYFLYSGKITLDKERELEKFKKAAKNLKLRGSFQEQEFTVIEFESKKCSGMDKEGSILCFEKKGLSNEIEISKGCHCCCFPKLFG